jgi:hypothetical protein
VAPAPKKAAAKKVAAKKTAKKATAKPTPNGRLDPVTDQFGPRLRAELEQVARSEAKILKGLSNKEVSELYLQDPAAALARIGVELPPILKQRLKGRPPITDLVSPKAFKLPNGQTVTASVNVRFTARKSG